MTRQLAEADGAPGAPDAVAVIGMAGRFPGARDLEEFWRNLRGGVESIRFFTREELAAAGVAPELAARPDFVAAGGALDEGEWFDAGFFGLNPRQAESLDPQHRLFLECAVAALEDAGYDPARYPGAIGLYGGASWTSYLARNLLPRSAAGEPPGLYPLVLANDKDFLTARVAYHLNLRGPCLNVQAACSTSLVAVHLACQALLNGECDLALAGGVSMSWPRPGGYLHQEGGILSPDGHCRAFDARARGTVAGQGVGIVVLKRLGDARADRDGVRAVLLGSAVNNDGSRKAGFTAPSVEQQQEVVREALAVAGIDAATVGYVEAHGTGTELGDPIEVAALTGAFRTSTAAVGTCALGSVKSNIGHLDAAAGIASLIKVVLALEHGEIPPSLHFESPNPRIDFARSPFYVNARLSRWPRGATPRRAGVSALGIGGTNVHLVVEEGPAPVPSMAAMAATATMAAMAAVPAMPSMAPLAPLAPILPMAPGAPPAPAPDEVSPRPWQLLTLSARSAPALERAAARLARHLRRHPGVPLADVAYTLRVGRQDFEHRRFVVCRTAAEGAAILSTPGSAHAVSGQRADESTPAVVFLFPGQGAQQAGMGRELYAREALFRREVDRCAALLAPELGCDLRPVLYPAASQVAAAAERLARADVAQPALFVVEYALARLWQSWGIAPRALFGHSSGEYVAACLSGVFRLPDALRLVAARGRLLNALPGGAMLAVPLPPAEVEALLIPGIELAAVNAPARCVVAGAEREIAALERRLAGLGTASRRLRTSHAFHCAAVEPAVAPFVELVAEVERRAPEVPFLSNATGGWITAAQATDPEYWGRQMRLPVRFADGLAALAGPNPWVLLEVGPGSALTTLARQQGGAAPAATAVAALAGPHAAGSEIAALLGAAGRLWLSGQPLAGGALHAGERRHRVPLPTYPFERRPYWVEPPAPEPGRDAHAVP
jgi:acyl transferase domain-containing protein